MGQKAWGRIGDVHFKQAYHKFVVHINIRKLLDQFELTNALFCFHFL